MKLSRHRFLTLLLSALLLGGCSGARPQSILILVSLDGFRWDYPDRGVTPNIRSLIESGVRSKSLIPIFPTKTYPNHYSIVTGLYAESHGIVANRFYDPAFESDFRLGQDASVRDGRWWGGEPIWVTLERQGQRTAPLFWPGAEAEIAGFRPTFWKPYDHDLPNSERIDQAMAWLDLPEQERPSFLTLYFSPADDFGHRFGPDSPGVEEGLLQADQAIGQLLAALEQRGLRDRVNLLVVSDHGMTSVHPSRSIFLDDYLDMDLVRIDDWAPVTAIRPAGDAVEETFRRLENAHPQLRVYRKDDVPGAYHYRNSARISPLIAIAGEGWTITTRAKFEAEARGWGKGAHGYVPELRSMHGIFIAQGPAFREGLEIESFENVHIYPLMTHLLGVEVAPNEGSFSTLEKILKD